MGLCSACRLFIAVQRRDFIVKDGHLIFNLSHIQPTILYQSNNLINTINLGLCSDMCVYMFCGYVCRYRPMHVCIYCVGMFVGIGRGGVFL